jgi:hypothetical protein
MTGPHHSQAHAGGSIKPDRTLSLPARIFSLVRGIPLRRTEKK